MSEFGGHALTLTLSTLPKVTGMFLERIIKNTDNECRFIINVNRQLKVSFVLKANDKSVRKVNYNIIYQTHDSRYLYNIYSLINETKQVRISNMSASGINTGFYLRGFEFAKQTNRLLAGKGDVLTSEVIAGVEKLTKVIQDKK